MTDPAIGIFNAIKNYADINRFIEDGTAEGLCLEGKSPLECRLNRDSKLQLSRSLSGFANTEGGVIIFGVGSDKKPSHGNLDILTQIEPIPNCKKFAQFLESNIPSLTTPPITLSKTKVLTKKKGDTKGVVVVYVPKTKGDPVQTTTSERQFYFRNGHEFIVLPHQMLQKLFAGSESPELHPLLDSEIVELEKSGFWRVPIIVANESSAEAKNVTVSVCVKNPSSCKEIKAERFRDTSKINPQKKIFMTGLTEVVHKGLNIIAGTLRFDMRVGQRPKRILNLEVDIYASKMRAHKWNIKVRLAGGKLSVQKMEDEHIY
ncbi:MAG: ATP-binding protein [Patescibacteria group bacterium]